MSASVGIARYALNAVGRIPFFTMKLATFYWAQEHITNINNLNWPVIKVSFHQPREELESLLENIR